MKKINTSRNQLCPCGSHKKYKHCCFGKKDWDSILRKDNMSLYSHNLSLHGKNDLFFGIILDIIQLEPKEFFDNKKFKDAITPTVVRKIHETIKIIWPDKEDLDRIFKENQEGNSALYTGWYESSLIIRGINRHSLYSDKILVVDPFSDPRNMREQFNPIAHPEKHLENTIRDIRTWVTIFPWVDAGIVSIIKNPCDFNYPLMMECMDNGRKRYDSNPDLEKYINEIPIDLDEEMRQYYFLIQPDEIILKDKDLDKNNIKKEDMVKYLNKMRDEHPFYTPIINSKYGHNRIISFKTGANFDMAKLIASATNSHMITDSNYRWKEIELEHNILDIKQNHWSSFAKSLQSADLKFLNNIKIENAIEIRKENYLERLRMFLSQTWKNCYEENMYSENNVFHLEEELKQRISEADIEWNTIKKKFISSLMMGSAASLAVYPTIANGSAELLIGSLALTGLTSLGLSWLDKNNFKKKFPASFFLKIEE